MFALLEKLKKKDKEAVALLYEKYGRKLYGHAICQWRLSEDDSWELVYKTLYKVIDSFENYPFEDENRFIGFIFRVFTNYLRNHIRDTKSKQLPSEQFLEKHEVFLKSDEEEKTPEKPDTPLMKCFKKAIALLDDWQRVLLLMRAQDFSYKDIAPYVDKPEKQLKVYHLRLRKIVLKNTNDCVKTKGYERK